MQRGKRRRIGEIRYVEKRKRAWNGKLKNDIQMGALTIERIVAGRYEWRSSAWPELKGKRKAAWSKIWRATKRRKREEGDPRG